MVVGYYREIYCALDIDEAEIIDCLINQLKWSNIKCESKDEKYTIIMNNFEDWIVHHLVHTYPDLERGGDLEDVIEQVKEFVSHILMDYL